MAGVLVKAQDCCVPCPETAIENVPGPAGPAGTNGTDGTDGINAFTELTSNFTVPAVSATAIATVVSSAWAVIGQTVFLQGGGDFEVTAKSDSTHVTLENLGYPNNVAPATIVPSGNAIGPSGQRGATGASGASATLNDIVTAAGAGGTAGDILADNGANSPNASTVRVSTGGAGANGKALVVDATQAAGVIYNTIHPNTATDNAIVRFNGTAGKPVPGQDSSLLITDDGAIQSTPTGGSPRGSKAVDLQVERADPTQVASGVSSVITGGINNKADDTYAAIVGGNTNISTGQASFVGAGSSNSASGDNSAIAGGSGGAATGSASSIGGGTSNTASATQSHVGGGANNVASGTQSSVGGGVSNTASAVSATVPGGQSNTASGTGATAMGRFSTATIYGKLAHASGGFSSVAGTAQHSFLTLFGTTTNVTQTEIFLDNSSAQMVLPDDTTWAFRALIVARRTDANDESAAYQILGAIDRNVGVATTALVAAITKTVIAEDTVAWDVTMEADAATGALAVKVTGENAKTIRWVATVELTEVTG